MLHQMIRRASHAFNAFIFRVFPQHLSDVIPTQRQGREMRARLRARAAR